MPCRHAWQHSCSVWIWRKRLAGRQLLNVCMPCFCATGCSACGCHLQLAKCTMQQPQCPSRNYA